MKLLSIFFGNMQICLYTLQTELVTQGLVTTTLNNTNTIFTHSLYHPVYDGASKAWKWKQYNRRKKSQETCLTNLKSCVKTVGE